MLMPLRMDGFWSDPRPARPAESRSMRISERLLDCPSPGMASPGSLSGLMAELRRQEVSEAFVLRAHRLKPAAWALLSELCGQVPMALAMVVHRFNLAPELRAAVTAAGVHLGEQEVIEAGDEGLVFTSRRAWWASASSWQFSLPV